MVDHAGTAVLADLWRMDALEHGCDALGAVMSAQVARLQPATPAEPPGIAEAVRRAQNAVALLRAGCPSLGRLELLKAARALDCAPAAPLRCPECGGTGFDEDARCDFCDGTGREGGTRA